MNKRYFYQQLFTAAEHSHVAAAALAALHGDVYADTYGKCVFTEEQFDSFNYSARTPVHFAVALASVAPPSRTAQVAADKRVTVRAKLAEYRDRLDLDTKVKLAVDVLVDRFDNDHYRRAVSEFGFAAFNKVIADGLLGESQAHLRRLVKLVEHALEFSEDRPSKWRDEFGRLPSGVVEWELPSGDLLIACLTGIRSFTVSYSVSGRYRDYKAIIDECLRAVEDGRLSPQRLINALQAMPRDSGYRTGAVLTFAEITSAMQLELLWSADQAGYRAAREKSATPNRRPLPAEVIDAVIAVWPTEEAGFLLSGFVPNMDRLTETVETVVAAGVEAATEFIRTANADTRASLLVDIADALIPAAAAQGVLDTEIASRALHPKGHQIGNQFSYSELTADLLFEYAPAPDIGKWLRNGCRALPPSAASVCKALHGPRRDEIADAIRDSKTGRPDFKSIVDGPAYELAKLGPQFLTQGWGAQGVAAHLADLIGENLHNEDSVNLMLVMLESWEGSFDELIEAAATLS